MRKISFLQQYLSNPMAVGAVAPSSRYLADKMLRGIDFEKARCIVEYGPGSGVFTDKLVEKKKKETEIVLIETNYYFYKNLKNKYKDVDNLHVFHGSAENVDTYLNKIGMQSADFIISGLPFASMPKEVSNNIINKTYSMLQEHGKFIAFQYSFLKKSVITKYFVNVKTKIEYRNFPPAFVFTCTKTNKCYKNVQ